MVFLWRGGRNEPTLSVGDTAASCSTTPGGIGQVLDAPEPEEGEGDTVAEQAREWKIAVEQAENVAKLAGKLPAGVTRSLEQAEAAGVDWRECCAGPGQRQFRLTTVGHPQPLPVDRSLSPGVVCEGTGEIAIAVDCSGSINPRQLGLFEAEVRS